MFSLKSKIDRQQYKRETVAIFSSTPLWMLHHAGTVELVIEHLKRGDEVLLVNCSGELASCPANKHHEPLLCRRCVSETSYTIRKILPKHPNLKEVKLSDYMKQNQPPLPPLLSRGELLDFSYRGCPIGRLVTSQLASNFGDLLFELDDKTKVGLASKLCASAINLHDATISLIESAGVTLTYTWNGRRPSDGPVWWASQSMGVRSLTYITNDIYGRLTVSEQSSVQLPRPAEVQDSINDFLRNGGNLRETALNYLNDYRHSKHVGMDAVDYSSTKSEVITTPLPCVTILLSSASESYHLKPFLDFFSAMPYSWVVQAVKVLREELPEHHIVVKWHPMMRKVGPREMEHIESVVRDSPGATHIMPDEDIDVYPIVESSDFTVSVGSSVAIWGSANGIPAIILGPYANQWGGSVYRVAHPDLKVSLRSVVKQFPLPPLDQTDLHAHVTWAAKLAGRPMKYVALSEVERVPKVGGKPVSLRARKHWKTRFDFLYRRLRNMGLRKV